MASATGAYAGDVDPKDAFAVLSSRNDAALVDVRTSAEWSFVGVPDLSSVGKDVVLQQWQTLPTMQVDPGFVDSVAEKLREAGLDPSAPVFFLCRSGARSQAAAAAMAAAGWSQCFNVAGGFEGPLDGERHRGGLAGWKADGLPWRQS